MHYSPTLLKKLNYFIVGWAFMMVLLFVFPAWADGHWVKSKNEGLSAGLIYPLHYDSKNKILYAGLNTGGLWRSLDQGEHWEVVFKYAIIGDICQSPAGKILITVAGSRSSDPLDFFNSSLTKIPGLYKSNDGLKWQKVEPISRSADALGQTPISCQWAGDKFVVGLLGSGVYQSDESVNSWEEINEGLPFEQKTKSKYYEPINDFYYDAKQNRLFAQQKSMQHSVIYAFNTTQRKWSPLKHCTPQKTEGIFTSLNSPLLYAAESESLIYNSGSQSFRCSLRNLQITRLESANSALVFSSKTKALFATRVSPELYYSPDEGSSWKTIPSVDPENILTSLSYDPEKHTIFVGGSKGIHLWKEAE